MMAKAKAKTVMPKSVARGILLRIEDEGKIEYESVGSNALQEVGMLLDVLIPRFQDAVQHMNEMQAIAYERGRLAGLEDAGHELQNVLDAAVMDGNAYDPAPADGA